MHSDPPQPFTGSGSTEDHADFVRAQELRTLPYRRTRPGARPRPMGSIRDAFDDHVPAFLTRGRGQSERRCVFPFVPLHCGEEIGRSLHGRSFDLFRAGNYGAPVIEMGHFLHTSGLARFPDPGGCLGVRSRHVGGLSTMPGLHVRLQVLHRGASHAAQGAALDLLPPPVSGSGRTGCGHQGRRASSLLQKGRAITRVPPLSALMRRFRRSCAHILGLGGPGYRITRFDRYPTRSLACLHRAPKSTGSRHGRAQPPAGGAPDTPLVAVLAASTSSG